MKALLISSPVTKMIHEFSHVCFSSQGMGCITYPVSHTNIQKTLLDGSHICKAQKSGSEGRRFVMISTMIGSK
jgi:hypothetical protein